MNPQRYTESQVLFGLREVWQDLTGVDRPLAADTCIYPFMKADGSWNELDFDDVTGEIESFFGFRCSDQEWIDFFGFEVAHRSFFTWEQTVAPHLTFGALAHFIVDRAPAITSFAPISVLGRPCLPAGVFSGIQRVVHDAIGCRRRFAPSTRVIDVLRGHTLNRVWSQLRWMTEHATPELPACWRNITSAAGGLGMLTVIASVVIAWATSNSTWILAALLMALALHALAVLYQRFTNPLPVHIVTFRDLAMVIAKTKTLVERNRAP